MEFRNVNGLIRAGTAVILTADALAAALQAVRIAQRSRRVNGLPPAQAYAALDAAITTAMSAAGHSDIPAPLTRHADSTGRTMSITEAAQMLKLSHRQTRRLAPKLGGRIIAGRWMVDEHCVTEHIEGHTSTCNEMT